MKKRLLIIIGGAAVLVVVVIWLVVAYNESRAVLPSEIVKSVNYTVLVPGNAKKYPVLEESVKNDPASKVLSYSTTINNIKVVINQQAEPEAFTEPAAQVSIYQKLLENMKQYKDLHTDAGTVTLTRPTELQGGQAAVLNANGTLLFAQPTSDLSDADWQDFFNSIRKQ
jgi:hypothetical protein